MKKMLVLSILVLSQLTYAAGRVVERITIETARTQQKPFADALKVELEAMKASGKTLENSPTLYKKVTDAIKNRAKRNGVVMITGEQINKIALMIELNPLETIAELTRLSNLANAPSSTPAQKASAKSSLEILSEGSKSLSTVTRTSTQAQAQQANLVKLLEVSRKVSELPAGEATNAFIAKLKTALREGKSIEQAVRVASNNKFGYKELKDCE